MKTPDSLHKLSSIESGSLLREFLVFPKMIEQFATVAEVHDEIKFGVGLESVVQLYDEGTCDLLEDVPLSLGLD